MILKTDECKNLTEQLIQIGRGRNYITATIPIQLLRRLNEVNKLYGPLYDETVVAEAETALGLTK